MIVTRVFAMPSPNTFIIPPIADLLARYLRCCAVIVDPFARNSRLATHTNDLNPETEAQSHMDAIDWLAGLTVSADALLIDPPYSPRQISEVYRQVGRECGMAETQNASLYRRVKDAADPLLKNGGVAICCGWNSGGMGIGREYELLEILLVNHGGAHNDTIVTVERKAQQPKLF